MNKPRYKFHDKMKICVPVIVRREKMVHYIDHTVPVSFYVNPLSTNGISTCKRKIISWSDQIRKGG